MDIPFIMSALSLAISLMALIYTRRKVLTERARYESAKAKELGKSISLDVLRVDKLAYKLQTADREWNSYDLKQVITHIVFTNTSERTVFLKALRIGIIAVSTAAYDRSPWIRFIGKLYPLRWGLQVALPFRFSDDHATIRFITTFPAGKRLNTPSISSREHPRLFWFLFKRTLPASTRLPNNELWERVSRADKFFADVIVVDERTDQPLSHDDWVEMQPTENKCWAIVCNITPEGAIWVRKSRLNLSPVYLSLEFNTCTVDIHTKMSSEHLIISEESEYAPKR